MKMDLRSRNIILNNKRNLEEKIDLNILKPFVKQQEIFSRSMMTDIFDSGECDLLTELVTRGPDALGKFRRALRDAGYLEEAKILVPSSTLRSPTRMCYKMTSKPLGFCKIINNVKFDDMDYRYGSDVDALELRRVFLDMGFSVITDHNLTGFKMRESLEKFAQHNWAVVDSCVIIILSHGDCFDNRDVIYGTDSEPMDKVDVYDIFDNHNCKPLQDKPKIFIFQACRGKKEDRGVTESTDAASVYKRPSMSDMLIIHSALPHHKSYRQHDKGSWFCQDLVQVLSSDYLSDPLETMLQKVDRNIANRISVKNMKQVTHIDKFGVKADIYFCLNNLAELPEFYVPSNRS